MKLNLRLMSFAFAAVGLFAVSSAKADTATFSVWENGISNLQSTPPPGSSLYSMTPTVTGSISNTDPLSLFNFYTNGTNDASLNSFLTYGGDSVVYNGTGATHAGDSINQSVFEFSGSAEILAGTYTFTKDDGMILVLNGSTCINAGNPTAAQTETCNVATSGVYNYQLYYDETNGPPAVLKGNFGATPEPSSFILLGSTLLGAAGMLRRRMKL